MKMQRGGQELIPVKSSGVNGLRKVNVVVIF